ncbi:MAG: hypothetical protein ACKVP7_04395 [Hyphomicrobiaceae bacterium]
MNVLPRLFTIAFLAPISVASAETAVDWMGDAEIRRTFGGISIDGVYADGVKFTESYTEGGRITYRDPRKAMSGRWSVVNHAFCTLYDEYSSGGCFKVSRHSANCYEFYFLTGNESEAAAAEGIRPNWTALGWDRTKPATCDEKPAV